MIERRPNSTQPQYGIANQAHIEPALSALGSKFDFTQLTRRGRLYLMCDQAGDNTLPERLYANYYQGKHLDPMHNLRLAVQPSCEETEGTRAIAGAVIHNMTLYIAGNALARGWIWRNRQLIQVVPDPRGDALGVPGANNLPAENVSGCLDGQRRLYPGDCVILANANSGRKISGRFLKKLGAFSANPDSLAKAIAQFTKSAQHAHPPVTVIQLPGKAATPQIPPQSQIEYAYAGVSDVAPRSRVSPILIAIIIATISIALAIIVTRPNISPELIRDLFVRTPFGSVTPGTTGTPRIPTYTPAVTAEPTPTVAN